jgi:hypothetical protein
MLSITAFAITPCLITTIKVFSKFGVLKGKVLLQNNIALIFKDI